MSNRNFKMTAGLLLLILMVGYWAYHDPLSTKVIHDGSSAQQHADYFLVNVQIKEYGVNGKVEYMLNSQDINHYPHTEEMLFLSPSMVSYRQTGEIINATAQNGKVLSDEKLLELWGDVIVEQTDPEKTDNNVRLNTEFLSINSKLKKANTDNHVLITHKTGKTSAIGMIVMYNEGRIELKSNVRGVYDPPQP